MATINNIKKIIYVTGKEDIDESLKIAQLISLGYTTQREREKPKSKVKGKEFYRNKLTTEEFEEFEKDIKATSYVVAVHHLNAKLGIEKTHEQKDAEKRAKAEAKNA